MSSKISKKQTHEYSTVKYQLPLTLASELLISSPDLMATILDGPEIKIIDKAVNKQIN